MELLATLKIRVIWVLFCVTLITGCTCKEKYQPIYKNYLFANNLKGMKINVISPASGAREDTIDALNKITNINFSLARQYDHLPFHSNSDEERFAELHKAIYDKESDIIWPLLGGYGSVRLFDRLKTLDKPNKPKLFIGYSDVTFLHLFFDKWGWKTIHGPIVIEMFNKNKNPQNFYLLSDIISTKQANLSYSGIIPMNAHAKKIASIKGSIIGGNLTLITNSLGTLWSINTKGRIVFIEDIGAKGYVIDRDLNHLKQAGIFKDAKAILFGAFKKTDDYGEYALKRFADEIGIPVFQSDLFGHGENNYPLVFGCPSSILKGTDGQFILKSKCKIM